MTSSVSPERRFVGAFLLGTAAVAVFDVWFPGLFVLLGACLLGYGLWQDEATLPTRVGFVILLLSLTYGIWRWLGRIAPDYVFPLVMIVLAVGLLLRFEIPHNDK